MQSTALAALVHDPEGRILRKFPAAYKIFKSIYKEVVVIISPPSTKKWQKYLSTNSPIILRALKDEIGENRRQALSMAASLAVKAVHSCDLDRAIFWAIHYPKELSRVASNLPRYPYTIIGRSAKAFLTHPFSQRLPELATNQAASAVLGQTVDVTSGSVGMQAGVAKKLVLLSKALGPQTDGEWPILASHVLKLPLHIVRVKGLAFETAYFHTEKWVKRHYNTLDSWLFRINMAQRTTAEMHSLLDGKD